MTGVVAVLGERALVEPYALGGAAVIVAETPDEVAAAWRCLDPETLVVVVTRAAAESVPDLPAGPMTVVLP